MPSNLLWERQNSSKTAEQAGQRHFPIVSLFWVLLRAVVAVLLLYWQNPSLPYQDDYDALLHFLVRYQQMPTLHAKLLYIAAAQHNEYHLILEHAFGVAELALTHHVNFAFLITFGYLFLLGIFYMLWRMYRNGAQSCREQLLEFLPISLIFFSLTYWETLDWAMTEFQNLPVIFFSLLALDRIVPDEGEGGTLRLLGGCAAACLAACSSPNGFLLLPLGLVALVRRRDCRISAAWIASFALPLAPYIYYQSASPHVGSQLSSAKRTLLFLATLGCAIPVRWVAIGLGLGIVTVLALALRARYDRIRPVVAYALAWVVLTVILITLVRGTGEFAIPSRYSIYSILVLIFSYSFFSYEVRRRFRPSLVKRFQGGSVVLGTCLCFVADVHAYQDLAKRRGVIVAGMDYYRQNPETHSPLVNPAVEHAYPLEKALELTALQEAVHSDVYHVPTTNATSHPHKEAISPIP